jgi:uncharacterized protein YpmS
MNKKYLQIYLVLFFFLVGSLSCRLPDSSEKSNGSKIVPPVKSTTNFEATLAVPAQSSSPVTITLTEAQVTSIIEQQLKSQNDQILINPQVHLSDGIVQLTGNVDQGILSGEVDIKFQIILDGNGKPKINLVSANIGKIVIPSSVLDPMIASIDLDNLADSSGKHFKIQSIEISDGKMMITGQPQ